jgi:hypothetical protein
MPDPSWPEQLAATIREALLAGKARTITVDSQAKAQLGRRAADRMGPALNRDPALVTFVVAP